MYGSYFTHWTVSLLPLLDVCEKVRCQAKGEEDLGLCMPLSASDVGKLIPGWEGGVRGLEVNEKDLMKTQESDRSVQYSKA